MTGAAWHLRLLLASARHSCPAHGIGLARRRSDVGSDEQCMATTINPVVHYRDLAAGARFLVETFGFVQHEAHKADDGSIQ
jgi:hypothetical protein